MIELNQLSASFLIQSCIFLNNYAESKIIDIHDSDATLRNLSFFRNEGKVLLLSEKSLLILLFSRFMDAVSNDFLIEMNQHCILRIENNSYKDIKTKFSVLSVDDSVLDMTENFFFNITSLKNTVLMICYNAVIEVGKIKVAAFMQNLLYLNNCTLILVDSYFVNKNNLKMQGYQFGSILIENSFDILIKNNIF